jgi:hypothetical protein
MGGLYIYGALLMAMAFSVGFIVHNPLLMAIAVIACGIAALTEALNEVAQSTFGVGRWHAAYVWVNAAAASSWVATAGAAIYAVFSLLGGL